MPTTITHRALRIGHSPYLPSIFFSFSVFSLPIMSFTKCLAADLTELSRFRIVCNASLSSLLSVKTSNKMCHFVNECRIFLFNQFVPNANTKERIKKMTIFKINSVLPRNGGIFISIILRRPIWSKYNSREISPIFAKILPMTFSSFIKKHNEKLITGKQTKHTTEV